MTNFHAVMIDETGREFGVDLEARNRDEAYTQLEEDYPESRVDQLEDDQQAREREQRTYDYVQRCLDDPYYDIDHCDDY
jgi:hypothetical protein